MTAAFALAVILVAVATPAKAAVVADAQSTGNSANRVIAGAGKEPAKDSAWAASHQLAEPLSARLGNDAIFARWTGSDAGQADTRDFAATPTLAEQAEALPEAERVPSFLVDAGPSEGGAAAGSATTENIDGPLSGAKAAWRHGDWDLYISGYAYHLPGYYTAARRAKLNANEWGAGLGRSIDDQQGNRHQLFFLVTQDSHYKPQYFAGYSWLHPFFPDSPVQFDFGISAFFFSRVDVANGIPLPGLLPFLTIGTKRVQLIVLYVPPIGKEIGGQTIYFYSRIQL